MTFFLTSSEGLTIFNNTGPRNLFSCCSSCSSVSVRPSFKRTLSNKTVKEEETIYIWINKGKFTEIRNFPARKSTFLQSLSTPKTHPNHLNNHPLLKDVYFSLNFNFRHKYYEFSFEWLELYFVLNTLCYKKLKVCEFLSDWVFENMDKFF